MVKLFACNMRGLLMESFGLPIFFTDFIHFSENHLGKMHVLPF